jgi:hypothetical protein
VGGRWGASSVCSGARQGSLRIEAMPSVEVGDLDAKVPPPSSRRAGPIGQDWLGSLCRQLAGFPSSCLCVPETGSCQSRGAEGMAMPSCVAMAWLCCLPEPLLFVPTGGRGRCEGGTVFAWALWALLSL